jgi:hypothetical protein
MVRSARLAPGFVWAILVLLGFASARAEFPQHRLHSVFPAGGRAGDAVEVTLGGADLDGVDGLWFDHPGLVGIRGPGPTFRVVIAPETPVGHHDVRVVGPLGVSNPRTFVVGDRPETREAEPNNAPAQANPIARNSVVNGRMDAAADIDCFAFDGRAGRRVFLEVAGARIDSRIDAFLRVLGPDGGVLAGNRETCGLDPLVDLTLPADGRYVVQLFDVIYAGSADHGYRLTLHDGPHLDAIVPSASSPGLATTFTLLGRNLGGEPAPDLLVAEAPLERRAVSILLPPTFKPDPMAPALDVLSSPAAGRRGYEFRLAGSSGLSNPVFIAEAIDPVVPEREPNDAEHPQEISLPCHVPGTFGAPGDLDVYRFRGHAGDVWWIEVWAERLGSAADPTFLLQKVDAASAPQDLAMGDDLAEPGLGAPFPQATVDAAVRWQVPEDGLYQVTVADLYGTQRGDPRLFYSLNIRPERPDFRLFVVPGDPAGALTVRAGGRATASVLAQRLDGFSGPIRVEARGLPAGVACVPVVIGPDQVQAPIVFQADDGARPAVGVASLVGRALAPDRKEVLAYAPGTKLEPEAEHPALGGTLIWSPAEAKAGLARATRGFVVAVREAAPFALSVAPSAAVVGPGETLDLTVTVVRRPGSAQAVQVSTSDLPPNLPAASATIAPGATSAVLTLAIPPNAASGISTIVLRGTGPVPFGNDPNASLKPTITVTEPSNPVMLTIRK